MFLVRETQVIKNKPQTQLISLLLEKIVQDSETAVFYKIRESKTFPLKSEILIILS